MLGTHCTLPKADARHRARAEPWIKKLAEVEHPLPAIVEYSLGYRTLQEHSISLGHDDIIPIAVTLLKSAKFRSLLAARYPIILIDEYQDTNALWIGAIKEHFLGKPDSPLFGFFGDHWQKIYDDGCGAIQHPALRVIGKQANFRSVQTVVDCLNRMRPELTQFSEDPDSKGDVQVFHTNDWPGARQTGAHWGGELSEVLAGQAYESVKHQLSEKGWTFSAERTKILMLTHRALAREQGYSSLPNIFKYNDAFAKKEHKLIAFLLDNLEPAAEAFSHNRYGAMFEALGSNLPTIKVQSDKGAWSDAMARLNVLRDSGTVTDVVAHLRTTRRPRLPDAVEQLESQLDELTESPEEEVPRSMSELQKLHEVSYREIIALRAYAQGFSPFETNHGVKGAEFENVLVIVGRGWSKYNFGEMLEWAASPARVPVKSRNKYEQNRNLMYVACSRPRVRLAMLFTQLLSPLALQTARHWFGATAVGGLTPPQ